MISQNQNQEALKHIPYLTAEEPITQKWVTVCTHVSALAKLVGEERDAKTLHQSHVVMSMLRSQKIHILLHTFERYRDVMKDEKKRPERIKTMLDSGEKRILSVMKNFEVNVHTILNHAFKFLMIHQRLNFSTVFRIYERLLNDCLLEEKDAKVVLACGVDYSSFSTLKSLLRSVVHLQEFDEDVIIQPIRKYNIMNLVIDVLHRRMKQSRAFAVAAGIMFLDTCLDTDAFATTPEEFISKDRKSKLIDIQNYLAMPLLRLKMLKKKARNLARWARKFSTADTKEIDKSLVEAIEKQLNNTAKMKDPDEKKPSRNQKKYATKKRANIMF
mmetsp:Transcript_14968/g.23709  ORF Transcript_14968/g.23709 Transcript_14968/m.23709 type:complete len:329 (-) Transcript_14968:66-1052(-)